MDRYIRISIPPGWRGHRYIESYGEMQINLDEIARLCGDRNETYFDGNRYYMKMPLADFKKICNLIVKYAHPAEFDTAEAVFTETENDSAKRIWSDAKTSFITKRKRKHSS